jgi:hypothetical protein
MSLVELLIRTKGHTYMEDHVTDRKYDGLEEDVCFFPVFRYKSKRSQKTGSVTGVIILL